MKQAVKDREINVVWHFTRLSNLDSILRHGLINRTKLVTLGYQFEINDEYRFDNQEGAVCCSISYPNYKMFYPLRMGNPDIEWITIGISPKIIWKKECAFCVENAASSNVTCIPIEHRKSKEAFLKLFEEIDGKPSRVELGIKKCVPTHPQAELLVFGKIRPKYIMGVVTEKKQIYDELKRKYPGLKVLHNSAPFGPRSDYEHWR